MRRGLVVAVALVLALAVPALASGARQGGQTASDRVPSAHVQATGSGSMTMSGRLAVNGTIPDRGTVVVSDREGDASAYLAGVPLEFDRRGRARVRRASGILYVTGSALTVQITGSGLTFSIAGNGRARFVGSGVYQLNSDPPVSWSRSWIRIAPSSSPPERRTVRRCAKCSSSAAPRR
jgi:hypothetical protein